MSVTIHTIVATYIEHPDAGPVVAVGGDFYNAMLRVNERLARRGMWNHLDLPEGDASVIRSTPQGNVKFTMEKHTI